MCLKQTDVFKDQKMLLNMTRLLVTCILKHLIGYLKISVQKGEIKEKPNWSLKEIMIKFKE